MFDPSAWCYNLNIARDCQKGGVNHERALKKIEEKSRKAPLLEHEWIEELRNEPEEVRGILEGRGFPKSPMPNPVRSRRSRT
jgi:hypothetical protein